MSLRSRLSLAGFVLASLVLAALPLLGQQTGKKYALLVGVNKYQHDNLPTVSYAVKDVTALHEVLGKHGYETILLTDDEGARNAQRAPTKANIERELRILREKCRTQGGHTFLIALAGHGLQFDETKDIHFCPREGIPDVKETQTLVSMLGVFDEMKKSTAQVKVLLVDACRNDPRRSRGARSFDSRSVVVPDGIATLFSCSAGELAQEPKDLGHGVFFYHVLQELRGAGNTARGKVTFNKLADYVMEQVPAKVKELYGQDTDQSPNQVNNLRIFPVLLTLGEPSTTVKLHQPFRNSLGMDLMPIPAGKFLMGSPKSEADRESEDKGNEAQHEVEITQPFYLGVYEVTQQEYQEVVGKNPSWFSADGGGKEKVQGLDTRRFPVETVSWDEAREFCRLLSARPKEKAEQRVYALPTEAQWEYACRGGARVYQVFHFGNSLSSRQANFHGDHPYGGAAKDHYLGRTTTVGSYEKNAFGLFDMHGNVWEWCADGYTTDNTVFGRKDPAGPTEGKFRVQHGGSWEDGGHGCRSACRSGDGPKYRGFGNGFRVMVRAGLR